MVVFACNNCGESLKKAQVANHLSWNKCRGCSVSCMDCSRDFDQMSYTHHIKCISEAEKYSGGNFKHKVSTLNNERKREEWAELIGRVAADKKLNKTWDQQELLNYLARLQSVPIKFKPFMAMVLNGAGRYIDYAESVWGMIQKEKEASMPAPANESPVKTTETSASKELSLDKDSETVKNGDTEELTISHKEKKKLKKQQKYEAELADVEANEEVEETITKKKKKSKKSQEIEEEEDEGGKKKKKKSKQNGNEEEVEENGTEKKKKKKSKQNGNEEEEMEIEENGTEKKKKKSKSKGDSEIETNGKKSKKRKIEADDDETEDLEEKKSKLDETAENGTKEKFAWQDLVSQIVSKKGSTTMKKLKRKITSEYVAACPFKPLSEKKLDAKLMKTLRKMPNIVVNDQCVELVQD